MLGGGVVVVGARWWWRGEGVDVGGVVGCGGWGGGGWKLQGEKLLVTEKSLFHKIYDNRKNPVDLDNEDELEMNNYQQKTA